ncbi:MAG: MarR family transcriptional regulator [Gammaproteobacteria bacterium]
MSDNKNTKDPSQSFGCLLHDTARLLRRDFNRRAQSLGLTQTQWQTLAVLSHNEGINQATLADLLEVQPITMARLIDRLESSGWLERRAHPTDRRSLTLYLTDKAEPILAQMWELAQQTRAIALQGVSEAEHAQIMKTLEQVKKNLLALEDGAETGNVCQGAA